MSTTKKSQSTGRSRRRLGAGLVATTLAAAGLPLAATPAAAFVVSPPAGGHSIISFPARDFISADGYTPGTTYTVNVLRSGFTVGTSQAVASGDGLVEVNHPAAFPDVTNCWEGVTPDIQGGDVIQVLSGPDTGDQTRTAGVTVTQKATKNPTNSDIVTIKGTATSATNGQIPIDQLEARVVANKQEFVLSGVRTLRADFTGGTPGGADGTLAYDFPGTANTAWTATWTGMNAVSALDGISDGNRAVGNESRGMWNGANPLTLTEQTIVEAGPAAGSVVGGPALPDCTAPLSSGPSVPDMTPATDTGVTTDNITTNLRPTFAGLAGNAGLVPATGVKLYVDGISNGTATVTGTTYSVTPTTTLTNGVHLITVGATAPTGPETMSGALRVTIDTLRPTVTTHAPATSATGASQIANITAKFSQTVTGVNSSTFTLKNTLTNAAVGASVTYSAVTGAALNPTASLAPATKYTATLSSLIKDAAGNALTAATWTFTTGPAPKVTKLTPAANLLAVSRVASPTATFSENVTGITTTSFLLRKTSTGVSVPATVSYSTSTHVATLNPSVTLTANTMYTAVLSVLIKDADGNRIPSTGWRFTTGR